MIIPDYITSRLSAERAERVAFFGETDSTNRRLSELAAQGAPAGTVVIADSQTAGRGRLGRSFSSPPGRGIYLSYLARPQGGIEAAGELTARTAVAVRRAVSEVCAVAPGIKWVNDLVLGGRKICGILAETSGGTGGGIIVGIGINVCGAAADFPPELRQTVSTVEEQTGRAQNRGALAAEI